MPEPSWRRGPPKTIVFASDLSSRCDRALDRTAQLANAWGAKVVVVHVLDPREESPSQSRLEDLPSWRRPPNRADVVRAQIRRDVIGNLPDFEVRVEEGDPASRIDAVARAVGADLIVIGVARDETFGRYLLGATVDRLVRHTPVPVLVVKRRARPYREILVATDFSESSRHALDAAVSFFPDAPKTLLHAFEVPFASFLDTGNFREQFRVMEHEACEAFVAGAALTPEQQRNLKVLVEHGAPERMVRAYMQDRDVDLVVLGTHGRSATFDALIGSTARRILEAAPGDVLLVREPRSVRD
jgi:nucleotide-binding universal stress UspA family protein